MLPHRLINFVDNKLSCRRVIWMPGCVAISLHGCNAMQEFISPAIAGNKHAAHAASQ